LLMIGAGAFYLNIISEITFPNSLIAIGMGAFNDNQLSSVTFGNNIESIGAWAFEFNQIEGDLFIPNSVTLIGNYAFRYNYILQDSAEIDNVEGAVTIGEDAFANNGADGQTTIIPRYLRE
jgi:hypothetical protein